MRAKRGLALLAITLAGFLFFAVGVLTATEVKVPDFISLDLDVFKSNRKGPVPFEHQMHVEEYEVACNECHHVYKEEKNVWKEGDPVQKCVECHDPEESKGDVKKLRLAYHKNCKGCHRDLVKKGESENAPYKKCKDCHEKK